MAFLDLDQVDCKEIDTEVLEFRAVVSVSDQVQVQDILWLDKAAKDVLTKLWHAIDHKVVSVEHQTQEES